MIKVLGSNSLFRKSIFIGSALTMVAAGAQGQSTDALLDKLVDKGILTAKEAKELREESDKNFTTAIQIKSGMPDWVTGYKLSGDMRGRYDGISSENNAFIPRDRLRYRLRVGLAVSMLDNLEAGLRLGSGEASGSAATGNPLSNNATLQDNGSKKSIFIDAAYGKWTAINSGGWLASITVGKMDLPFAFTPMVFDPDLTPEGAAIQTSWAINDKHSLSFSGGAFVLDEVASSTHDPFLFGGQFLWNATWTQKLSSTFGAGMFQIVNPEQLTTGNVPFINRGNTREQVTPLFPTGAAPYYALKYNYNPIIADASVTYTLDTFPFYTGRFPIKFAGEFMNNPAAKANNNAFWVGMTFGKSGAKQTWDLSYRYEYLESDAWYDQLVDDDNGAFYPGVNFQANSSYGYFGGTNIKGHMIKLNYSFTDSLTFSATCYLTDLISLQGLSASPDVPNARTSATLRIMADVMWKF